MNNNHPLYELKLKQKELANKIRKSHDLWDSVTFRHYHIAYCEIRGRKRSEIENPAENNKPNESSVPLNPCWTNIGSYEA